MARIAFGKESELFYIGDGLSRDVERCIREGKYDTIARYRYYKRTRVHNQKEEMEAYCKFSDELVRNPKMLDPVFIHERSISGDKQGYYDVVASWTEVDKKKKSCYTKDS